MNIALTNRCNLTCKYCDIWKEAPKNDISPDLIGKLFKARVLDKNIDITLTGGEPFLHKDFLDICKLISEKRLGSLKTVSTNGLLVDNILLFLDTFDSSFPEDFALHISFDGAKNHERIRGIPAREVMSNIKLIKKSFPAIAIKLKFTITQINYNEILSSYGYSKRYGLGFKIKLVENAANYTNKINIPDKEFDDGIKKKVTKDLFIIYKELKNVNRKESLFIENTIKFLHIGKRITPCRAPSERIFIMPEGKVYSCIHFNPIGNLNTDSLDNIWNSKKAKYIRGDVARSGCNNCVSYHGSGL